MTTHAIPTPRRYQRPENRLRAVLAWFRQPARPDHFGSAVEQAMRPKPRSAKRVADVAEVLPLLESYAAQHRAVTVALVAEVEHRRTANAESPIRTCPDCQLTYHSEFQSPICPHRGSL